MNKCFTCGVEIDEYGAYCEKCVEEQERGQMNELEAFNAYHRWIDKITHNEVQSNG